jgi:hypothetical protein
MIFTEKISLEKNGKEFIKTREFITNIFYGVSIISYVVFWIFKSPDDAPSLSLYLTCLFSPVLTYGLYQRAYYYMFNYNWFHALYLGATLTTFLIVANSINIPSYTHYVLYEIGHLFVSTIVGILVSIVVSLPFKLIHYHFLNANKFYYDSNILDETDKYLFPEKYKVEKEKKKEEHKYDTMNETVLQAELAAALKEERFEDAEKIKKILETKFR